MASHSHGASSASSDSPAMPASSMQMVFFASNHTPLYSSQWQPTTTGAYAGTCIFLILLATIFRGLIAGKYFLERRWKERALGRRYIRVQGMPTESETIDASKEGSFGKLVTARGVEEHVKVVTSQTRPVMPWRLSVDLPRAIYVTATAGVGYFLMLAVMTLNVGYFLSVLSGVFAGELVVGRYMQQEEH